MVKVSLLRNQNVCQGKQVVKPVLKNRETGWKVWLKHLLLLGIGSALLVWFVSLGGKDTLQQLGHLRLLPLVGSFLATLGITSALALRWGSIANTLVDRGRVAAWHDYYHYFITSRALGLVLPKDMTDMGGRIISLNQFHGLSLHNASAAALLDRLFDLLSASVFLVAVFPYWLSWVGASVSLLSMVAAAVVGGGVLFAVHEQIISVLLRFLNKTVELIYHLPWLREQSPDLICSTGLNRRVIVGAYGLSLIKFSCTVCRLVLFSSALNLAISPQTILLGAPLGQFSYLFAFTPGGLGIFEAGWLVILELDGVGIRDAATFVVGQRILTVGLVIVLALCSQLVYMVRRGLFRSGVNTVHPSDQAFAGDE